MTDDIVRLEASGTHRTRAQTIRALLVCALLLLAFGVAAAVVV